jgi:hypothetical protein
MDDDPGGRSPIEFYEAEIRRLTRELRIARRECPPPGWRVTRLGTGIRIETTDDPQVFRDRMGEP